LTHLTFLTLHDFSLIFENARRSGCPLVGNDRRNPEGTIDTARDWDIEHGHRRDLRENSYARLTIAVNVIFLA